MHIMKRIGLLLLLLVLAAAAVARAAATRLMWSSGIYGESRG